jgi:hypothetical protein
VVVVVQQQHLQLWRQRQQQVVGVPVLAWVGSG